MSKKRNIQRRKERAQEIRAWRKYIAMRWVRDGLIFVTGRGVTWGLEPNDTRKRNIACRNTFLGLNEVEAMKQWHALARRRGIYC
jgi:hypothetical protein